MINVYFTYVKNLMITLKLIFFFNKYLFGFYHLYIPLIKQVCAFRDGVWIGIRSGLIEN